MGWGFGRQSKQDGAHFLNMLLIKKSVGEGSRVRYWDDEWWVYMAIAFLSPDFLFT